VGEIHSEVVQARSDQGPELSAARLRIAVGRLSRRLRPTLAAGALTPTEVDLLVAAERRGPVRMSELAAFAGLNPTMLSRIIPKLEAAKLILRLADPTDRRACLVEASPEGERLLALIRAERNDALSELLESLAFADRQALADALPVLEQLAQSLAEQPLAVGGPGLERGGR
jgi:DNA-binding MarR family transcriptional regulator